MKIEDFQCISVCFAVFVCKEYRQSRPDFVIYKSNVVNLK